MNIIEIQDSLKDLPDSALMKEMQAPTGSAPQFLVLSELKRRKRMRDDFQRRQNADMKTVAEEVVTAAGAPQEGIMQMSRAMAPNSSIAQNTGMDMAAPVQPTQAPQMMADGGVVKMQQGGVPEYAQKATFLDTVRKAVGEGTWSRQRSQWVDILGEDAVREAESALMPFGGISDVRMDKMQDIGIFGNSPGRNIGGEGIASVATSVENFMATPSYEKGTGRATMVDGTFVEVMPDGNVFDARTGEMVTGDLVQKAIAKLSPDLAGDTAAFTEFAGTPSMYNLEAGMPTQEDLSLRSQETAAPDVFTDVSSFDTDKEYNAMEELKRQAAIERGGYEAAARAEDAPTFTGDVLPYLGGVTKDLATSSIKALGRPAENDMSNPYVASIASALEGPTGTEEMAEFLENENRRFGSNADRFDSLGFTPITGEDGTQRFISPAGMVYDESGKLVSGGEAMQAMDIAQSQGEDFSKSPMGSLPLGSYDTDESGNVIPDSFSPLSIPVGVSEGPEFLEGTLGPESTIGNLLGVQEPPVDTEDAEVTEESAIPEGFRLGDGTTAEGGLSFGDLLPKGTDTSTTPAGRKSTSTSGGTGGGVGGRIAQMLADREKSAEADKWMALAQTGMALMASKQPTLGGALGEAGLIGVGAMQKSRQQYDKDILDLLTLQERSRRTGSKGGLTAGNMITLVRNLQSYKGDIEDRIKDVNAIDNLDSPEKKAADLERLQAELMRTDFQIGTYMNALSGGSTGGQSFDVSGGSQSQGGVGFSLGTPTS